MGNPRAFREVHKVVQSSNPQIVFLCETRLSETKCRKHQTRMGFANGVVVGCRGKSGGLGLWWASEITVDLCSFNEFHID